MIKGFSFIGRMVVLALTLTLPLALPFVPPANAREPQPWPFAAIHLDAASTRKATRLAASPNDSKPESATSDSRARTMVLLLAAMVALLTIAGRQHFPGNASRAWTIALVVSALAASMTGLMRMFPFVLTGQSTQSAAEFLYPISCAALAALVAGRFVSQFSNGVRNAALQPAPQSIRQRADSIG